MPDVVDEMQLAARSAIAEMKEAAIQARALHARAELLRHMRTTAAKLSHLPLAEAAEHVGREWMKAWHLDGDAYAALATDVSRFTRAFCADARASTPATQQAIRDSLAALDAAFDRHGTTLADQMAWRSECAHGWWELVLPAPADLPDRPDRPGMPRHQAGTSFWEAGCAPHCGP